MEIGNTIINKDNHETYTVVAIGNNYVLVQSTNNVAVLVNKDDLSNYTICK